MGDLKQYQASMTIQEQIENLNAIGLIIKDEEYAKKILNDISYFRLIKAYSLNMKQKNGKYHDNIMFEQIVDLYLFNARFRQILIHQIEKVEINLRCRITNYFGEKYGILGYLDVKKIADGHVYFGQERCCCNFWCWLYIFAKLVRKYRVC